MKTTTASQPITCLDEGLYEELFLTGPFGFEPEFEQLIDGSRFSDDEFRNMRCAMRGQFNVFGNPRANSLTTPRRLVTHLVLATEYAGGYCAQLYVPDQSADDHYAAYYAPMRAAHAYYPLSLASGTTSEIRVGMVAEHVIDHVSFFHGNGTSCVEDIARCWICAVCHDVASDEVVYR